MRNLIPRRLLTITNTGTLICVGIAETACNLPLPGNVEPDPPGSGGAPGLEIPGGTETASGGQEASSTGGQPGGEGGVDEDGSSGGAGGARSGGSGGARSGSSGGSDDF